MLLKLVNETFNRPQGLWTNMVLHPLDIVVNDIVLNPKHAQEISQKVMLLHDVARQRLASGGQDQATVFFVLEEPFRIKPLDHVGNASLRDFQPLRNIGHSRVAFRVYQVQDLLEVILNRRGTPGWGLASHREDSIA